MADVKAALMAAWWAVTKVASMAAMMAE